MLAQPLFTVILSAEYTEKAPILHSANLNTCVPQHACDQTLALRLHSILRAFKNFATLLQPEKVRLVQAKQLMEQHARGLCNLRNTSNSKRNYTADRYSRQTGGASSSHFQFLIFLSLWQKLQTIVFPLAL